MSELVEAIRSLCRELQSHCVTGIKTCKAGRTENKGRDIYGEQMVES